MAATSAGILMYRETYRLEVLLVHPGGPYWKNKEEGAWSIPKGELQDENAEQTARREFQEETGYAVTGELFPLTPVKQKSGKMIIPFGVKGNIDAANINSNKILIEWPPRSGRKLEIPEVDKASWMSYDEAMLYINPGQQKIIIELFEKLEKL